jgi:type I restriction enzyme, S subunit
VSELVLSAHERPFLQWLNALPVRWERKRFKHLGRFIGGGTPSKDNEAFWKGNIPWVSPKDMKASVIVDTEDHISKHAIDASSTTLLPIGCVLIVVRSGILKHTIPIATNDVPVTLNQDMKGFVPGKTILSQYLLYLIQGNQQTFLLEWRKAGATVESLENEFLTNTILPVPSLPEQRAIAAFLDRKTAQIDAVVAKKRRLIQRLQEKRQALISHAVTKGLDPHAPMKDSGIEWLGEVPAHWTVERLKFHSPHVTVGIVVTPAKYYVDDGVSCLRSLNVRPFQIRDSDLVYMSEESNRLHAKSIITKGDVVAVRTGQPGTTAVVDERFDGANCIDLIVVRKSQSFSSDYLCYFMNSATAHVQYGSGSGGAIQQHFNIETASNLLVTWPPIEEQRSIVERLSRECGRLNRLEEANRQQISKLQEYRQTLISAAVTGKIDVAKEAAHD